MSRRYVRTEARVQSFLAELRRRNVIRMAGLYLVGAWLIVQVAGTVLPMFGVPDWIARSIVLLLAIGFVPALVFSWVFELTPQGLKRDSEVPIGQSIGPQTARRMDRLIIVVLVVALAYFAFDKFVIEPRREAAIMASVHEQYASRAVAMPKPAADGKSIAVLPFVNMSGDPRNEYFSDGITEEILNALAQIPDLKVAARTSAFAFKGKDPDLRKVGDTLGVATVLEGSVQRAGDEVRINAQLVDTRNGYQLWSEKYDRKLTSIFAVEDEISKAIADKLKLQLNTGRGEITGHTVNPQAHELYLRGLSLIAARGKGVSDAVDVFSEAVKLDPQYAQAWGALAIADALLPGYRFVDFGSAMARSETAAQNALKIDPATPSALAAMGNVYVYRLQWARADEAFRKALKLAPSDVEAINQYAQFLLTTGQTEAALRVIDRARQIDPLSAIIGVVRGTALATLGRDADATKQFERVLAAHPGFYPACMNAVLEYIRLKRFADAEAQMRAVATTLGVDARAKVLLVRGIADPARREAALHSLGTSPANADLRADSLIQASFLTLLGDRDHALEQLQVYATTRNNAASGFLWIPSLDPLRDDPRYKAILHKLHLPYHSSPDNRAAADFRVDKQQDP